MKEIGKKWILSQQKYFVVEVFTVTKEFCSQYMDATFAPKKKQFRRKKGILSINEYLSLGNLKDGDGIRRTLR